mmetsp:Transcript_22096/g.44154  ORF Transcript_22096/g.44154 Transcript_22096/m.44154 type:complete len:120 (-) Transcript_22096:115-474(-)
MDCLGRRMDISLMHCGEQHVMLVVQKLKRHTMSLIKMGNKEKILAVLRYAGTPNLETVTWEDTEMQTIQLIGKLQCSRMTVHVNPFVLRKDAMSKLFFGQIYFHPISDATSSSFRVLPC